ncbi:hypothetical protein PISMIDRAFT_117744, partial [Pisolithus microcarpus 441]
IDIVVSATSVALSPIFYFHSMAVMNFVSTDTIYCSYPRLTFQHLSLVNAGALYYGGHTDDIVDAMRKYMSHGFEYVRCKDVHNVSSTCKVCTRSLTGGAMMSFNFLAIPSRSHTMHEVFREFGILNLQWCLGGMPCGLELAFCHPHVDIVEEES